MKLVPRWLLFEGLQKVQASGSFIRCSLVCRIVITIDLFLVQRHLFFSDAMMHHASKSSLPNQFYSCNGVNSASWFEAETSVNFLSVWTSDRSKLYAGICRSKKEQSIHSIQNDQNSSGSSKSSLGLRKSSQMRRSHPNRLRNDWRSYSR